MPQLSPASGLLTFILITTLFMLILMSSSTKLLNLKESFSKKLTKSSFLHK